jgi:hypothetical protein
MNDDAGTSPGNSPSTKSTAAAKPADKLKPLGSIFLVSYPKVVFLYPTFLTAVVAGIYMLVAGNAPGAERHDTEIVGLVFLTILTINLVVFSFDFPRTTSLTLFFFGAAVVMGLVLLFRFNPDLLPVVTSFLKRLRPWANSHFYFTFATVLAVIYVIVAINVQFDYWEVRPNELLHHHGIMSDLKRYSAPSLRIDKEINDIFEYMLLRAGRLILHPSNEPRAIVLENVFFINTKEEQITKMLGALQVQVRSSEG